MATGRPRFGAVNMSTRFWRRALALSGGALLGIGMVTAPGTATVAAKTVPGRTLVVVVNGLGPQTTVKVKVKGPKKYARTLRVNGRVRLTQLRPGRYKIIAKKSGKARPTDRVQTVRVRKAKGAKVKFRYRTPKPDTTAPDPVTDLRLVERTSTSIRLAWQLPEDLLEVKVERSGGTSLDPLDFQLNDAGDGLTDTGLTPNATYTYRVATLDEAGNQSPWESITVSTLA